LVVDTLLALAGATGPIAVDEGASDICATALAGTHVPTKTGRETTMQPAASTQPLSTEASHFPALSAASSFGDANAAKATRSADAAAVRAGAYPARAARPASLL
jgi:hypothetical protein